MSSRRPSGATHVIVASPFVGDEWAKGSYVKRLGKGRTLTSKPGTRRHDGDSYACFLDGQWVESHPLNFYADEVEPLAPQEVES